jgi:hypothetical protein
LLVSLSNLRVLGDEIAVRRIPDRRRRLGDDASVVLFCVANLRIRVRAPRCDRSRTLRSCVNVGRIITMLPVVQRSARVRAAAPAQNAIATKAKRR